MKDKLYKLMDWPAIEAIVYGEEASPQNILGRHIVGANALFQTFQPNAKEVILVIEDEKNSEKSKEYIMELADEEGFYAAAVLGKAKGKYHYVVTDIKGRKHIVGDPYAYDVSEKDECFDRFVKGEAVDAYEYMGAHLTEIDGTMGALFRVWAPNALRVSVVGAFNDWNGKCCPMIKNEESGIFSLFIPGLTEGEEYKYEINAKGGQVYIKQDPYAQVTKKGCVTVPAMKNFKWNDDLYLAAMAGNDRISGSLCIYQTDISEFLDSKGKYVHKKTASVIDMIKKCGYNYIQLMMSGDEMYLLPSGVSADDIKKMVQSFHAENIGVIYEWNPSYFAVTDEGMGCFDGTYLYGHLDERKRYNTAFSGYYFNYARPEVKSYLMSNANYWLKEFHFDGIHVEGLSSMLYLDYGKYDGEWTANIYGGHENLEAIDFIKKFNYMLHKDYPYAISLTREEGAYPCVTSKLSDNGLGFDYLWNNGHSEDYLAFMRENVPFMNVNKITDNMSYAYCENYVLTISKDDVVAANEYNYLRVEEGASFYDYIPVADENKDDVKRATLAYYMARPGKKLFYKGQVDCEELADLNNLYRKHEALSEYDCNPDGFEWVNAINTGDGVISFIRKAKYIDHSILVVCNFSENEYKEYKVGVPYEGKYKMIFTSDDKKYGGKSSISNRFKPTEVEFYDGRPNSVTLKLAPRSVTYYSYTPYTEAEFLKMAEEKVAKFKENAEKEARKKAKELNEMSSSK